MNTMDPCLTVFLGKECEDFIILNLAVDPEFGFCVPYNKLVRVSNEEMRRMASFVLIDNLKNFGSRKPGPAEFSALSQRDRDSLIRESLEVGVSLRAGKVLNFAPMKDNAAGGRVGDAKDRISLPIPSNSQLVYERLMEAFRICES